jgi:hypothetical protein
VAQPRHRLECQLGLIDAPTLEQWSEHRLRERQALRQALSQDPQNFAMRSATKPTR